MATVVRPGAVRRRGGFFGVTLQSWGLKLWQQVKEAAAKPHEWWLAYKARDPVLQMVAELRSLGALKRSAAAKRVRQPLLTQIWGRAKIGAREYRGMLRGAMEIDPSLRFGMWGIVIFSVIIAVADAALPWIAGDAIRKVGRVSYGEFAVAVCTNILIIRVGPGIFLEFVRHIFSAWFFRIPLKRSGSTLAMERGLREPDTRSLLEGTGGKVLEEGRINLTVLVETLLVGTVGIVKGFVIAFGLLFTWPLVGLLVLVRMVVSMAIMCHMDSTIHTMCNQLQRRMNAVVTWEVHALRPQSEWLNHMPVERRLVRHRRRLAIFLLMGLRVEFWRSLYMEFGRDSVEFIFHGLVLLIGGWYLFEEPDPSKAAAGLYMLLDYAYRACAPLNVLMMLQGNLTRMRQSIYQFGLLTNINFGIRG